MSRSDDSFHWRGAFAVFVATQIVYLLTLTVSCPFWDSGEYIATSYILGIPHPPGTPLYVLIGRVVSMIPFFELVATRINWLSALSSSVCASFLYLTTVEIYARWRGAGPSRDEKKSGGDRDNSRWIGFFAGAVAAGFAAFGRTFWDNAIEAEVYALSSAITAIAFWLILRWARPGERGSRTGLFVLLYYLACMSMGIHLGTFLVLPGIVLFAFIVDRRIFGESNRSALLVAGLAILLHPGLLPTLGIKVWAPVFFGVSLLSLVSCFRPLHPTLRPGGLLAWCALAAALGISTHFYLLIRAGLDPAINEADPSNFEALWKVLIRDQYRPPNPFTERKADLSIQLTRHFWDYARDQYSLGVRPAWLGNMIPYLIGTAGLVAHAIRDRKSFLLLFVTYAITSFGLVFYLNFSAQEVRPRDYFFVASFQFYAIWIGLGIALFLEQFRQTVSEEGFSRGVRPLVLASGVLCLLLPALTVRHYWHVHDRTGFHVAADYARNMLVPLEQNAILFTNGDNDTFPLWYLQEVEGVRKDVRVINLSLLNTEWYIHQVEEYEPKVRIGWTQAELQVVLDYALLHAMADQSYAGWTPARLRQFVREKGIEPYIRDFDISLLTKDLAVARILEQNPDRPVYVAVTVPDAMGLGERLVMEGLVFSLREPVPGSRDRIDLDQTIHLLTEVYRYRGILDEEDKHDYSVYKDINSRRLTQNYSAAFIQAADQCYAVDREVEAARLTELAVAITPGSNNVRFSLGILHLRAGEHARAAEAFAEIVRRGGADARTFRYLGRSQELLGQYEEAEQSYRQSYALSPNDPESLRDLFSYVWEIQGKRIEALQVLEGWLQRHPDDREVLGAYRVYRDSLQTTLRSERRPETQTPADGEREDP